MMYIVRVMDSDLWGYTHLITVDCEPTEANRDKFMNVYRSMFGGEVYDGSSAFNYVDGELADLDEWPDDDEIARILSEKTGWDVKILEPDNIIDERG